MQVNSPAARRISDLQILLAAVALLLGGRMLAPAGDWPGILGPHRNGVADEEFLDDAWPATGPLTKWSYPLGEGYAGPAVVGHQIIVFHRVEKAERLEALDSQTGKSLWHTDFPANYRGGVNPDRGPRCVPLVADGQVYAFGAAGDLYCVDLATGRTHWSRAVYTDFQGDEGYFGAGSTPIVIGNKLLINVGGRDGGGLAAFDRKTGETLWKATTESASYSSPILTTIDAKPTAIFVTRLNCLGVDPETGDVRFQFPYGKRGPTVNAAMPLVFDQQLFLSSSYGVGAVCARLKSGGTEPLWRNDSAMSSQFSTSVYQRGFLFGVHGREDVGETALRCLDAKTGKVQWSEEDFGVANVILAGQKLLVLKTSGALELIEATPAKYQRLASAQVAEDKTRALPALAAGCLYLRTNSPSNNGELKCVVVGQAGKPKP